MFWGLIGKKKDTEVAWGIISFDLTPSANSRRISVDLKGRVLPTDVDELVIPFEEGYTISWTQRAVHVTGEIYSGRRNTLLYLIEKINKHYAPPSPAPVA